MATKSNKLTIDVGMLRRALEKLGDYDHPLNKYAMEYACWLTGDCMGEQLADPEPFFAQALMTEMRKELEQ